jgi:hypothetical protein
MKKTLIHLLAATTAVFCLSSCSNNSNPPQPLGKPSLGQLYQASSCNDVENYVKNYATNHPGSDGFGPVQPTPALEGDAGSENNSEEPSAQVQQSDIAFADSEKGLLYAIQRKPNGGELKIFQVNHEDSQELSHIALDFKPRELIAVDDSSTDRNLLILFGQDLDGLHGITAIYQINNPAAPQKLFSYKYLGYFGEARTITNKTQPSIIWTSEDYLASDKNIDSQVLFPSTFITRAEGETSENKLENCADTFLYQNEEDSRSYAWLTRSQIFHIDLSHSDFAVSAQSILSPSGGSFIQVNPEHLYLIQQDYFTEAEVYQFDIPNVKAMQNNFKLSAYTEVPGYIKDQFFMDEYQGSLGIFHQVSSNTCDDCAEPMPLKTNLAAGTYFSSYQQSGKQLVNIGRIGPFAPEETPFSARFVGPWAYVITFRQVDPLFVVNRADPKNPKLLDEFKIEEVSHHLQPIPTNNETQLLLGMGGLPNTGSIVANLFAIDGNGKVTLADQLLIEAESAYSLSFHDYRALTFDATGLNFALPYTRYNDSYSHVAVFSIEANTQKFNEVKKMAKKIIYEENASQEPFENLSSSEIKRAFFFEEVLVPVSEIDVAIHDLLNLEQISQFDL